jgi:hypothetical protein
MGSFGLVLAIIANIMQYQMIKILSFAFLLCFQMESFSFSALPEFSAVYNPRKKTIIIKWHHSLPEIKTYVIQQSSNNKLWNDVALQEVTRPGELRSFYFEDTKPAQGKNDYRLKCIYKDGRIVYSIVVTVMIGSSADGWAMYPVPVTNLINLDYRGTETIKGVINILIQHPTGKVFIKLRYASLGRQFKIPVDNLPRGIYDIRIIVQNEVIWNQRFVK